METFKVLTWTVYQKKLNNKWYAVKRIEGKVHNVYIGKNPAMAEKKILEYCKRKKINAEELTKIAGMEKQKTKEMQRRIKELEGKLAMVEARNSQLEVEIQKLSRMSGLVPTDNFKIYIPTRETPIPSVLGFIIYCNKDGRWYANRYSKGKLLKVYIGKYPEKAESKIKEWVKKNGIELTED